MDEHSNENFFGVKRYFLLENAALSLDCLVLKAQKEARYKDELYGRLLPAIQRACHYYQRHYPFLDESETFFAVFNTTEHLIKIYREDKGSFLAFWSSCVKACLSRLVAKTWRAIKATPEKLIPFEPADPRAESEPTYHLPHDYLLENIAGNCQPGELSAYILYLAGYSANQSAQMLGQQLVSVQSAIKKVNLAIDKNKVSDASR